MKKSILITILIGLLFSIHCNRENSQDVKEIVIKPKDGSANIEFIKKKSIIIDEISYCRIFLYNDPMNKNPNVYVYGYDPETERKYVVKKYDENLNYISRHDFPFGQGPGDVGPGTTFYQVNELIYAPDNTTRRVGIFDKDFNYIKYIKVIDLYLSTTFSKDGKYFYGFSMREDPSGDTSFLVRSTFPRLNKKTIYCIGTFWIWNEQKKHIVGGYPLISFFIKNNKVYFLNSADYRIIIFDMDGKMLKKVRMDVPPKKVPKEKKKEWLYDQYGSRGVKKFDMADVIQPASWAIPLEKGFVVSGRKSYSTDCRGMTEADYFDYQLNLAGKTRIPCFYRIFDMRSIRMPDSYLYHAGYLYLVYEDEEKEEFYLEKWKVEEKL